MTTFLETEARHERPSARGNTRLAQNVRTLPLDQQAEFTESLARKEGISIRYPSSMTTRISSGIAFAAI